MAENPKAGERQERLKAALRENLKRRKSQVRARVSRGEPGTDAPSGGPGAPVRPDREKD
jgi:hypothetical protein